MSTSFSLSLELIYLMNWLLKKDRTKVKTLVKEALESGLLKEIEKIEIDQEEIVDTNYLHDSILEFLIFLEDALLKQLEKKDLEDTSTEKFIPTIQKISPRSIDLRTLWVSMQQAKNIQIENKDLNSNLYSQLIKNWKPKKSDLIN